MSLWTWDAAIAHSTFISRYGLNKLWQGCYAGRFQDSVGTGQTRHAKPLRLIISASYFSLDIFLPHDHAGRLAPTDCPVWLYVCLTTL